MDSGQPGQHPYSATQMITTGARGNSRGRIKHQSVSGNEVSRRPADLIRHDSSNQSRRTPNTSCPGANPHIHAAQPSPSLRGRTGSPALESEQKLSPTLFWLAGGTGMPISVAGWRKRRPKKRMDGLLGMAIYGSRVGMEYREGGDGVDEPAVAGESKPLRQSRLVSEDSAASVKSVTVPPETKAESHGTRPDEVQHTGEEQPPIAEQKEVIIMPMTDNRN